MRNHGKFHAIIDTLDWWVIEIHFSPFISLTNVMAKSSKEIHIIYFRVALLRDFRGSHASLRSEIFASRMRCDSAAVSDANERTVTARAPWLRSYFRDLRRPQSTSQLSCFWAFLGTYSHYLGIYMLYTDVQAVANRATLLAINSSMYWFSENLNRHIMSH